MKCDRSHLHVTKTSSITNPVGNADQASKTNRNIIQTRGYNKRPNELRLDANRNIEANESNLEAIPTTVKVTPYLARQGKSAAGEVSSSTTKKSQRWCRSEVPKLTRNGFWSPRLHGGQATPNGQSGGDKLWISDFSSVHHIIGYICPYLETINIGSVYDIILPQLGVATQKIYLHLALVAV